jgi:hypothetical protein
MDMPRYVFVATAIRASQDSLASDVRKRIREDVRPKGVDLFRKAVLLTKLGGYSMPLHCE